MPEITLVAFKSKRTHTNRSTISGSMCTVDRELLNCILLSDVNHILKFSLLTEPVKVVNRSLKHRVSLNPNGDTNLMCVFEGQNIHNVTWNKMDNLDMIVLPNRYT